MAIDRVTGEAYVIDDLQPADAESPHGLVDVFDSTGSYEGHLKYEVVVGGPSGLAVDNSAGSSQGLVYVTSGNTHHGGIYAYLPGAATTAAPIVGTAPPPPLGGTSLFPVIPVGRPTSNGPGLQIACEGDACQILPSEPQDPPLATLAAGTGNPRVRYRRHLRRCRPHHRHSRRTTRRCSRKLASPSAAGRSGNSAKAGGGVAGPLQSSVPQSPDNAIASAPPGAPNGFDANVSADGGGAATLAGSHPYALSISLGLDQSAGEEDLRDLRVELPPGLLADPAAVSLWNTRGLMWVQRPS